MGESPRNDEASLASLVGRVADEFLRRQERGERPEVAEYLARYPQASDLLRKVLHSLQVLEVSAASSEGPAATAAEGPASGTLGDFRLLREVGRGGMGIVYEAEQISLGRRVALKVLPFATMDPRHLQRFHNEARAAAGLHHEHIVAVHAVGCDRGVHYYAMQFIDGQTLEALIRQLRRAGRVGQGPLPAPSSLSGSSVAQANGRPAGASTGAVAAAPDTVRGPQAAGSTRPSLREAGHPRRVAAWGIQAAEALEHAHQRGVVHRDVKPANLLLDEHGKLWVTDFGLARTAAESGLTMSGDLMGTLRYMSPEQALARHGLVDHRSDVYALGVTLYELLTLRPAVSGKDRQEIMQQIALAEPPAPRAWDRAIPNDLETIVLKAMAKNPAERYATAKELADDLRSWLEDRPIRARRPSVRTRLGRWGRRHQTLVVSAATAVLMSLAVLAASVGWIVRDREAQQTKRVSDVQAALREAQRFRGEGKLAKAQAEAKRAAVLLDDGVAVPALAEQVQGLLRELAEEDADGQLIALLGKLRL